MAAFRFQLSLAVELRKPYRPQPGIQTPRNVRGSGVFDRCANPLRSRKSLPAADACASLYALHGLLGGARSSSSGGEDREQWATRFFPIRLSASPVATPGTF